MRREHMILLGLVVGAVFGWLAYTAWAGDASDASGWTAADQPPAMVGLPTVGIPGSRPPYGCANHRLYPASLSTWDGSVVGDC